MAKATDTKPATGSRPLAKYCKQIGATWTWDKYRPDEITITFSGGRSLITTARYPEDFAAAAHAAEIFLDLDDPENPFRHSFREISPNTWHTDGIF